MDSTLNALAHKFHFEMLEEAARHQTIKSEQGITLRYWLGSLLVSAGETLQASRLQSQAISEVGGHPLLDTDMCVEAVG